jgi:hypothetical protein
MWKKHLPCTTQSAKPICLFCWAKYMPHENKFWTYASPVTSSSILDGFNNYKLHILRRKGTDIMHWFKWHHTLSGIACIVQVYLYKRIQNLVGFNNTFVTNVPGCVWIKIHQNFPNKIIGLYKDCSCNIQGNE